MAEYNLPVKSYSIRKSPIQGIVIHYFSCRNTKPNDMYNVLEAKKILDEYGFSYHALITQMGDIYRLLQFDQTAYHAGISRLYQYKDYQVNDVTMGYAYMGIHEEPPSIYQYSTLAKLCAHDLRQYSGLHPAWLVGHDMIAGDWVRGPGAGKVDPGPNFDWKLFYKLIFKPKEDQ